MNGIGQDVRYALRGLGKHPGFTALAVLTLAVGIGGTTAVFSVVNGVLIKPLPYPNPDALVGLWHVAPGADIGGDVALSAAQMFTYRDENRSFAGLGLWSSELGTVTGIGQSEEVRRLTVAHGTLETVGAGPALGRSFSEKDDTSASPPTVMLTHDYWQRRFGGERAVIGRFLTVDAQPREVIGVMPSDFRFLDIRADVILPMRFDRSALRLAGFNFQGLARLKPGVTLEEANADVARMNAIWARSWPEPVPGFRTIIENIRLTPTLRPLKQDVIGDIGSTLWMLLATIGFVLLIACANVANLLLVRAERRQQELAIRVSLGAGRARIARELLIESALLGVIGGAIGLCFAHAALRLLVSTAPVTLPRLDEINIDATVTAFAILVSLGSSLVFGLFPAAKHAAPQITHRLRDGARSATASRERHRARNALVVTEVALSLILLVASGLMIRTFLAMRAVDPGFSTPERVQLVRISVPEVQVPDPERVFSMQSDIRDGLASLAGVSAVSFASSVPMDGNTDGDILLVEGRSYPEGQLPPVRGQKFVAPGFFSSVGVPLVAGRDVTWTDMHSRAPVALVSASLAREMWQSASAAIGQRIRVHPDNPWREIIGVVGDVHDDGVHEQPSSIAYFPVLMDNFGRIPVSVRRTVTFAVRSSRAGTEGFVNEIRSLVAAVTPDVPATRIRTLRNVYDDSMARTSFVLTMLSIAAAMALLLGVVGIYGVVSYAVAARTREIGIRSALGAHPGDLKQMFVTDTLLLVTAGATVGAVVAVAMTRFIASHLFGVKPTDVATYAAASLVLFLAAMLASYVPARRAARVDPLVALRYE